MTDEEWWEAIDFATSAGARIAGKSGEFDAACNHIVQLIKDASSLLESRSHATSAFLSITAIEETAKVHIGMYRRTGSSIQRSKDPLYKHGQKHLLALGPTIAMGSRLQKAIGEHRLQELLALARDRKLVELREAALYIATNNSKLITPKDAIAAQTAKELLLLSIEAFDDGLVGLTNHTGYLEEITNEIFNKWTQQS